MRGAEEAAAEARTDRSPGSSRPGDPGGQAVDDRDEHLAGPLSVSWTRCRALSIRPSEPGTIASNGSQTGSTSQDTLSLTRREQLSQVVGELARDHRRPVRVSQQPDHHPS